MSTMNSVGAYDNYLLVDYIVLSLCRQYKGALTLTMLERHRLKLLSIYRFNKDGGYEYLDLNLNWIPVSSQLDSLNL